MNKHKILGYCVACHKPVYSDSLTNYNKSVYVCKYCNYPNDKSDLDYSMK